MERTDWFLGRTESLPPFPLLPSTPNLPLTRGKPPRLSICLRLFRNSRVELRSGLGLDVRITTRPHDDTAVKWFMIAFGRKM